MLRNAIACLSAGICSIRAVLRMRDPVTASTMMVPARIAMPWRPRAGTFAITSIGIGGLLSGCTPTDAFPPACPELALVRDAADITRFNGSGRDVTDTVLDGRIERVPARCERDGRGLVKATLHVEASLARGPAGPRSMAVPYFVAVADGDRVLDKQDYTFQTKFPANTDRVTVIGGDVVLELPVTPQKSAAAYRVYVGFQLSPDELALNRQRGAR